MVLVALTGLVISWWVAAAWFARRHRRWMPSIDRDPPLSGSLPSILVVVPARNEENNVEACLDALIQSDYPRLRIRLMDDQSTDRTAEIARAVARRDSRVEVTTITDFPDGWLGKNNAMWQGVQGATEDWLLFVDADLRVSTSCISRAVAAAERARSDLLTVVARLVVVDFWEVAVLGVIAHCLALALNTQAINSAETRHAAGFGPFMLFRRSAYEAIGGHASVRAELVEDLRIAEAIKAAGFRLRVAAASESATLRMYDSLSALVGGWSKNFHVALKGRHWAAPFLVTALLFFYAGPWVLLILSLASRDVRSIATAAGAVAVALMVQFDFVRAHKGDMRWPFLAPLGAIVMCWILATAVIRVARGKPATWKGRTVPG